MESPIMYVYKHAGEKIHSNMDEIWGINVSNLNVLLKYLIYEVKQLESDYRLFNMLYRLLEF